MSTDRLTRPSPDLERAVVVLRGLAYEHRLHILILLTAGEQTPSSLADALTADTTAVSHHLRALRAAGLIRRQRRGSRVFYALHSAATARLIADVLRYAC